MSGRLARCSAEIQARMLGHLRRADPGSAEAVQAAIALRRAE